VALFRRRPEAPEPVHALLPPDERLLAWGTTIGGGFVVASNVALYLPDAGGATRIPYETVQTASWEDPVLNVVLVGEDGRHRLVRLEETGDLPAVVRERVTSTVLVTERVALSGQAGALVIARRPPQSDDVLWQVVFDAGLDADDPQLRADAADAVTRVRASTGL
jgi:hypothetical protein